MRILTILSAVIATFATTHATVAAETTWKLALDFHVGERLAERTYENDRVDWKLPQKRLQHFEAAGVIINEEQHVTTTVQARVVGLIRLVAMLQGDASVVSVDVPRHHTQTSRSSFSAALGPNNMPVPPARLQIEDAAMSDLPQEAVSIGQHWTTHLNVNTTLGSGEADFDHTLVGYDNGLLEVAVHARGQITGAEYHLPKLLPGTISLDGVAWYDPSSGLVVRESYSIHNRLIKPMEGEDSGFDELLSVDTSARKL